MADPQRYTFKQYERVTGVHRIDALFNSGKSFVAYPFRVVYCPAEHNEVALSVLISVPKKKFKGAVRRNRVKRLFREAYRLNKHLLSEAESPLTATYDMAFIYISDKVATFQEVEKGVKKALLCFPALVAPVVPTEP